MHLALVLPDKSNNALPTQDPACQRTIICCLIHLQAVVQLKQQCTWLPHHHISDPELSLHIFSCAAKERQRADHEFSNHRGLQQLHAARPGHHERLAAQARVSWPDLADAVTLRMSHRRRSLFAVCPSGAENRQRLHVSLAGCAPGKQPAKSRQPSRLGNFSL